MPGAQVTQLFDDPWYTGSASSQDVPYLFQVALNGHGYLIDPEQYRRSTIPAVRQPVDGSVEPGEQTLSSEGIWRRSQENWVLGAGQEYFDNRQSQESLFTRTGENRSIRYRFWKSKGVDPWTEGRLTLLHATENKFASASTTLQLLAVGTRLYYTDGTNVKYTNDPTVTSPTWTTVSLGGQTPVTLATDGSTVWIACSGAGNVRSSTAGTNTSASFSSLASVTKLAYCNGRLIAAVANQLYEIARDGTSSTIGSPSNNNPSFTYTDIVGAPNAIYACGYAGNHGEIYSIVPDTTTGVLNPPVWACGLPFGETPNTLHSYAGIIIVGTSDGVRVADISRSDNALAFGPVILISGGVKCLDPYGEFCWFGWSNYSITPATDPTAASVLTSGLGRLDLARNTATDIPAYSSDVQTADGVSGTVLSLCSINGKRYFAVSGVGIFGESADYVSEGFLQSGMIRFGTVEPKVVCGGDWRHDSLPTGAAVGMIIMKENGGAVTLAETNTVNALGSGTSVDASLPVGESFQVQMYLKRGSTASTAPVLRRWTVRSLVTPQRMDEIILPIIMRSRVEDIVGEGQYHYFNPRVEWEYLKTLEASGEISRYQEGASSFRVYVDRVEVQPDKWRDDRSFFEGMILVRLLSIPGSS